MRVIAAISGGVDSAVAAARAVDAGYDVIGVHLALGSRAQTSRSDDLSPTGCLDARRVADVIGIPLYIWDLSERFALDVIEEFVKEYAVGRTPNPCLRCNEKIKFGALLDRAVSLGFDAVVTGHHARLGDDGLLRRSVDSAKDQSYVLAVVTPQQLRRTILPLGNSTKKEIRLEASRRGIPVAHKPDSSDICFITDGDIKGFLSQRLGPIPGEIIDVGSGQVLGHHHGAYQYTIGQRRGLDLRVSAPDRRPRYVVSVDASANTVMVGPSETLNVTTIHAERAVWNGVDASEVDASGLRCYVQMRAHGEVLPAVVTPTRDGGVLVRLIGSARGIAPGQTVVAYCDDSGGDIVACSATMRCAY